jgi:hypothetical protein
MKLEDFCKLMVEDLGYGWKADKSNKGKKILSEKGRQKVKWLMSQAQSDTLRVLAEFREVGEDENNEDREEITGLSTKGTNANFCNSGFGGGSIKRLVTA